MLVIAYRLFFARLMKYWSIAICITMWSVSNNDTRKRDEGHGHGVVRCDIESFKLDISLL